MGGWPSMIPLQHNKGIPPTTMAGTYKEAALKVSRYLPTYLYL